MIELSLKLIAAIAPAIILTILIIRRDREHPEPIGWLLASAGLGVVAGLLMILLCLIAFDSVEIDSYNAALYQAFVYAALPEEILKFCMLFLIANRCRHFDEYFDGIVYAVCIGMGFAGFENFLYLCGDDDWLITGIARALLAVPAHYFFAVIMGAFFAPWYFDKGKKQFYLFLALFLPIMAHGLYDFLCFSIELDEDLCVYLLLAFLICFRWIRKFAKTLMAATLKLDSNGYPIR